MRWDVSMDYLPIERVHVQEIKGFAEKIAALVKTYHFAV